MMRNDVNSNIEFIKAVENNPCLYNQQDPEYGNNRQIQQTWKKIAKTFNTTDVLCRRTWRLIRASYIRSINNKIKSGKNTKDYYLSSYLTFLKPFLNPKLLEKINNFNEDENISENVSNSSGNDNDDDDEVDDENDCDEQRVDINIPRTKNSNKGRSNNRMALKRKRGEDIEPMALGDKRSDSEAEEAGERDPCEMYLLSLAPHLRAMGARQQLHFQRGVVDLIENIMYGN